MVNVDYNIVENMKITKVDVSMFELSKLEPQWQLLTKAWKDDKNSNTNEKGKETDNIVKTSISS